MYFIVGIWYNPETNVTHFYRYYVDTDTIVHTTSAGYVREDYLLEEGSLLGSVCEGSQLRNYYYDGGVTDGTPSVSSSLSGNDLSCCTISVSDFQVQKTNNTDLVTPAGTITISSTALDINDYEASINGGTSYITAVGGQIQFTGKSSGTYNILIREIDGVCFVSTQTILQDIITYPPLIIEEIVTPSDFCPVFYPIETQFELVNNQASVKSDLSGTYLTVATSDGRDYFLTKPIFRVLNNADYAGTYEITEFDDSVVPNKFYFDATYTTDQTVIFVPFGQQVFNVFAETSFNTFEKIADVAVSPDTVGIYKVRSEGFLQSVFDIQNPYTMEEINLSRKFYIIPASFDLLNPASIKTAVFSAVSSLDSYLDELTPLAPIPINFINEQTEKGYPVLFSRLNLDTNRVSNVLSSGDTDILTTASELYIPALPDNTYRVQWINDIGPIGAYSVSPSLPSWIVKNSSPSDTIDLTINTITGSGGDYSPDDYSNNDYSIYGFNSIVGCYEYDFYDGVTLIFTLRICVYPVQAINMICGKNLYNIAWVNQTGGWSSFVFEGKKTVGMSVGKVKDFKRNGELRKSSVDDIYTEVEVSFSNKTIRELMFISSLRTSIQAYLFNDSSDQWDIPIYITREDFPVYQLPFRQVEVNGSFTFLYSEEIKMQKQ
jgi:hypothetical protein